MAEEVNAYAAKHAPRPITLGKHAGKFVNKPGHTFCVSARALGMSGYTTEQLVRVVQRWDKINEAFITDPTALELDKTDAVLIMAGTANHYNSSTFPF